MRTVLGIAIFAIIFYLSMCGCGTANRVETSVDPMTDSGDYYSRPFYGKYDGDVYSFTLGPDGFEVSMRRTSLFYILNDVLVIQQFDDEGNEIGDPIGFNFSETDSTYVISTRNGEYTLKKRE